MSALFIDDGHTAEKALPAVPGLHPGVDVQYRPALSRKRLEYAKANQTQDPAKIDAYECSLLEEHVVTLNGEPLPRGRAARLVPTLRNKLLDLVLGYEPAQEKADLGN